MKSTPIATSLDLERAAEFLGLHPDTLRERAAAGIIPGAKIGKRWVFLDVDLAEWMRLQAPRPTRKRYLWANASELVKQYVPPARVWMRRKRAQTKPPTWSGIYFLYRHDELTYVGSSCCVSDRIRAHATNGRAFTHYACVKVPGHLLFTMEDVYIAMFRPSQNKARSSRLRCVVDALMQLSGIDNRP